MTALPVVDLGLTTPLCSYRNLRGLLGPHASKERLSQALDGSTTLQQAANKYFRSLFTTDNDGAASLSDFRLKKDPNSFQREVDPFPARIYFKKTWPLDIVVRCATFLDFEDLLAFSTTCKSMREVVTRDRYYSELLWSQLLEYHGYISKAPAPLIASPDRMIVCGGKIVGGEPGNLCVVDDKLRVLTTNSSSGGLSCFFTQFAQFFSLEKNLGCIRCGALGCVPVIYGFPSQQLLEHFRQKKLKFGGDNLIEGLACWSCSSCNLQVYAYPWKIFVFKTTISGNGVQESGRARYRGARAIPWSFGTPP